MGNIQSFKNFFQNDLTGYDAAFIIGNNHFCIFEKSELTPQMNLPDNNRNFYMIGLVRGAFRFYYSDQLIETGKNTLLFIDPTVSFRWDITGRQGAYCCIFTEDFLKAFQFLKDCPLFKPGVIPAFDLCTEEAALIANIYRKMYRELHSDFTAKSNVLWALLLNLVYVAFKKIPLKEKAVKAPNPSQRIVNRFLELLELQFPIASIKQHLPIRHPADFAEKLSMHVNHLNRALKDMTGKTTTQHISQRLLKEASALLEHTDWNIYQIGRCLGFEELPHFINFFKKGTNLTPKAFRQQVDLDTGRKTAMRWHPPAAFNVAIGG